MRTLWKTTYCAPEAVTRTARNPQGNRVEIPVLPSVQTALDALSMERYEIEGISITSIESPDTDARWLVVARKRVED